jgi:hypothetical protein
MDNNMHFYAYLEYKSLNIYQREKYSEQNCWKKLRHIFHARYFFSVNLKILEIFKQEFWG